VSGLPGVLVFAHGFTFAWHLDGAALTNLWFKKVFSATLAITGLHDRDVIGKAGDIACTHLEGF